MQITNRKAKFKYHLLEDYEAGIELKGGEIKAIKTGMVNLDNSYAKPVGAEIYLVNANIPTAENQNPTRSRRLLMHKQEIISISSKIQAKKLTLVPLALYTKGRLVKVRLALARTKKQFEKKEAVKKKDIERELQSVLKSKTRITKL